MNLIPGRSWLRAWSRRRLRLRDPDFADMGTAFGLDASMGPAPAAADRPAPVKARRRRFGGTTGGKRVG